MVPFRRGRLHERPKCWLGRPDHDGYFAALCSRPHHSLDHNPLLSCPARERSGNCDLPPSLLLGRNRQRFDPTVVQTSAACIEEVGANRLRVRAAGPERLEPLSPLSSRLDSGIYRIAVLHLGLIYPAFPEKLISARGRSLMAGILERDRQTFARRATRRGNGLESKRLPEFSLAVRDLHSVPL